MFARGSQVFYRHFDCPHVLSLSFRPRERSDRVEKSQPLAVPLRESTRATRGGKGFTRTPQARLSPRQLPYRGAEMPTPLVPLQWRGFLSSCGKTQKNGYPPHDRTGEKTCCRKHCRLLVRNSIFDYIRISRSCQRISRSFAILFLWKFSRKDYGKCEKGNISHRRKSRQN